MKECAICDDPKDCPFRYELETCEFANERYAAAFRAGAEAMREAAAQAIETAHEVYVYGAASGGPLAAKLIRTLPLPEPTEAAAQTRSRAPEQT